MLRICHYAYNTPIYYMNTAADGIIIIPTLFFSYKTGEKKKG